MVNIEQHTKTVIIGRPGTGKTHYLMGLLDEIDPRHIIFISFTRAAVQEARKRAMQKWGIEAKELPYFRTIHSLCARLMGLKKEDFLPEKDVVAFWTAEGIPYDAGRDTRSLVEAEEIYAPHADDVKDGNRLMALLEFIKNIECKELGELQDDELNDYISIYLSGIHFTDPRLDNLGAVADIMHRFETMRSPRLHYADILLEFLKRPNVPEDVIGLIVDEFQDLSPLSYRVVKELEWRTSRQWYAGDPNQAIYSFMGASPDLLLGEWNSDDVQHVTLKKSYRLPAKIWDVATGVINSHSPADEQITDPLEVDVGGEAINIATREEVLPLLNSLTGSCYILTRTNVRKREWMKELNSLGIPYRLRGQGKSLWQARLVAANNFVFCVKNNQPIDRASALTFLKECLPAKPFLKRGSKSKLEELLPKKDPLTASDIHPLLAEGYTVRDILTPEALRLSSEQRAVLTERLLRGAGLVSFNISLGTIHSHKGGEASVVVYDAHLSNRLSADVATDPGREAEEARVAYVALTRARQELWIVGQNNLLGVF